MTLVHTSIALRRRPCTELCIQFIGRDTPLAAEQGVSSSLSEVMISVCSDHTIPHDQRYYLRLPRRACPPCPFLAPGPRPFLRPPPLPSISLTSRRLILSSAPRIFPTPGKSTR